MHVDAAREVDAMKDNLHDWCCFMNCSDGLSA